MFRIFFSNDQPTNKKCDISQVIYKKNCLTSIKLKELNFKLKDLLDL